MLHVKYSLFEISPRNMSTNHMTCISRIRAHRACIVAMATVEVIYHTIRYCRGEIESKKEYGYHISKGIAAAVGMGLGNWGGGSLGTVVGGVLGGPLGAFILGIIGGVVGGIIGTETGRKTFDALFEDKFGIEVEQAQQATLIKDALLLFGYANVDVIDNEEIFNKKKLEKKYRELAKMYHPDTKTGSHALFHTLNASLGCLLSLLQEDGKVKKSAVKNVKEIQKGISWH